MDDPIRCPLCGEPNACGLAAGGTSCWCFTASVPSATIEQVPAEARGVVCICAACARRALEAERHPRD